MIFKFVDHMSPEEFILRSTGPTNLIRAKFIIT
jgi:hypothetical protein